MNIPPTTFPALPICWLNWPPESRNRKPTMLRQAQRATILELHAKKIPGNPGIRGSWRLHSSTLQVHEWITGRDLLNLKTMILDRWRSFEVGGRIRGRVGALWSKGMWAKSLKGVRNGVEDRINGNLIMSGLQINQANRALQRILPARILIPAKIVDCLSSLLDNDSVSWRENFQRYSFTFDICPM